MISIHWQGSAVRQRAGSLSPSTGPEGVSGELAYVGAVMPADYSGIDERGKIVLSDGLAMPGKTRACFCSCRRLGGRSHSHDQTTWLTDS